MRGMYKSYKKFIAVICMVCIVIAGMSMVCIAITGLDCSIECKAESTGTNESTTEATTEPTAEPTAIPTAAPTVVAKPSIINENSVYSGKPCEIKFNNFDDNKMKIVNIVDSDKNEYDNIQDLTDAGNYKITVSLSDKDNTVWYGDTTGDVVLDWCIKPKELIITANDNEITYGDEAANSGVTYDGFVDGEGANNLSGTLEYSYGNYDKGSDVGEYGINISGLTSKNYDIKYTSGTLKVKPKELIITANDKEITYGDEAANSGVTCKGFVEGENEKNLSGTLGYSYGGYDKGSNVGNYEISISGLTSDNYDITYVSGTLKVNPKELIITANDKEITYGDEAANSDVTYVGFVDGEGANNLSGTLEYSYGNYDKGSNVGNYEINISGLTSKNYDIKYTSGTLKVNPKELIITANNKEITYGDEAANSDVTYVGFVGKDDKSNLSGSLKYSYGNYDKGSNVGNYEINISGLTSDNYDITYVSGTLKVKTKELIITANDKEITYGDEALNLGVKYYGFVEGESEKNLSGSLKYSYVNYDKGSDVGNYEINISGLTSDNYDITYVSGTLKVKPKELIITANDKEITYGDEALNLGVKYYGFVEGESEKNLSGSLEYSYVNYDKGSDVGNYEINISGLTSDNYDITYVSGTLIVKPKDISKGTISLKGELTYNGSEQTQEIESVTVDDLLVTYDVIGESNKATNAGEYMLKISGNGNFIGELETTYTIQQKEISLIWSNDMLIRNGTVLAPEASAVGLCGSDTCAVTVTGGQTEVGSYTAIASALSNSNYKLPAINTKIFTILRIVHLNVKTNGKKYVYELGTGPFYNLVSTHNEFIKKYPELVNNNGVFDGFISNGQKITSIDKDTDVIIKWRNIKTNIKKIKVNKGKVILKFNKADWENIAGFKISYSRNKKFKKKVKSVNVKGNKVKKYVIKNAKKKMTNGAIYYIKVQFYYLDSTGKKVYYPEGKATKWIRYYKN